MARRNHSRTESRLSFRFSKKPILVLLWSSFRSEMSSYIRVVIYEQYGEYLTSALEVQVVGVPGFFPGVFFLAIRFDRRTGVTINFERSLHLVFRTYKWTKMGAI